MDTLEAFREGLALARRAGIQWWDAERAAREAALSVIPRAEDLDPRLSRRRIKLCAPRERAQREAERDRIEAERDEWASVLYDTRTAWMRAYERRPIGCSL
jgi:hypothetical protein